MRRPNVVSITGFRNPLFPPVLASRDDAGNQDKQKQNRDMIKNAFKSIKAKYEIDQESLPNMNQIKKKFNYLRKILRENFPELTLEFLN